jgi:RNA polymerase sigma factor (TIGR02999 family)
MTDVTRLLDAAAAGDRRAAAELLPLVYAELRKLAAARMADESPDHTLQPTALVHEAYLRLVGRGDDQRWDGHGHFFAAAAEAMRRILVDSARRKSRLKRGGSLVRQFDEHDVPSPERPEALLAMDEALEKLAATSPQAAELVKLRFFAGCSSAQAASLLGISPRKADQVWAYARAWLREELGKDDGE